MLCTSIFRKAFLSEIDHSTLLETVVRYYSFSLVKMEIPRDSNDVAQRFSALAKINEIVNLKNSQTSQLKVD